MANHVAEIYKATVRDEAATAAIRIHNIWVNSSGTLERSYNDIPRDKSLLSALDGIKLSHPSWTSMVITITNPSPIGKE